jgi:predicted transcriptional regulator
MNIKNKYEMDELVEAYTLEVFKIGCDNVNYRIIKSLPTTTSKLRDELHLSKMPFYTRLNKLSEVGLIEHIKRKENLNKTELTDAFIKLVDNVNNVVKENLPKYMMKKMR